MWYKYCSFGCFVHNLDAVIFSEQVYLNKNERIIFEYPVDLCVAIVCFWNKHKRSRCRWRNTIYEWTKRTCKLRRFFLSCWTLFLYIWIVLNFILSYLIYYYDFLLAIFFHSPFHYYQWADTFAGGLLVPEGIIRPVMDASVLSWFKR